jgi:hypothetical protein
MCVPNDEGLNIIMRVRGRYLILYVSKFERHSEQSVFDCFPAIQSWRGVEERQFEMVCYDGVTHCVL